MRALFTSAVSTCIMLICGIVIVLAPVASVQAGGVFWCKSDPVISVNERLVDITPSIPLEYLERVNGPTQIQIKLPSSVNRAVVVNDLGFMGYGSEITFTNGSGTVKDGMIPLEIRVSVPMDLGAGETAPLDVRVWPDNALPTSVVGTNQLTIVRLSVESR